MKKRTKKLLAGLLAVIMLLTLLPMAIIGPFAEEVEEATYAGPALNETIVGTVNFQSFNFLGDNTTGEDGTDYSATFYYTDDYFAHSAINNAVTEKSVPWDQLEDTSLATASMDLAVAAYTSAEGDVLEATNHTWENSNYEKKDKNIISFLSQCGFKDIKPSDTYTQVPTSDSIAYTVAQKPITVWDEESQSNKDYTLIAVGIRGAGYGAEWASNVTVGDPSNPSAKNTRHKGFDDSAVKVVEGVRQYIAEEGITGEVKYWVSGFSRAAAVANLAAARITDEADNFHTKQSDVYGYTYECPQAAATSENALAYKNIHNIINAMDVVPRVSPSSFEHQRLGIDYVMPYYGNTSEADNTMYYTRMREVLKTIAIGNGTDEDPLIKATDPANYPYNRKLTPYKMSATELVADAIDGSIMTDFGTEVAKKRRKVLGVTVSGNVDKVLGDTNNDGTSDWYLDNMLDAVLDVFLLSGAWDRGYSSSPSGNEKEIITAHKARFVETYQEDMRKVLAYMLDFSGPAFLGLVDSLMGEIAGQLKLSNADFAVTLLAFYNFPSNSTFKENFIKAAQKVAVNTVNDMTANYEHDSITRSEMNDSLRTLVAMAIDLYGDELDWYESQYLGTCLKMMNEILSTHEQETVLSWITALDDNHINRGYRTLTLPANTNVKLLEFREQFEGPATFDGDAPVVAEYNNGVEAKNLDMRIYAEKQGDNLVIRYPASLDIRADVTTLNGDAIDDLAYQVADYQTTTATEGVSVGAEQYEGLTSNIVAYNNITNTTNKTNAKAINDASNEDTVTLGKHDTFMVLANGTSTFDNSASGDANVYDTKLQKRYEITWQNEDETVLETDVVDADTLPVYNGETPVKASTDTTDYTFSGWRPEVTAANADTTYIATYNSAEKLRTGHNLSLKGNIGVNFYYYIPSTYNGTLELKFQYRGQEYTGELTQVSESGFNYKAPFTVAAKEMTEPITATLTQDGEVINEHTYTVKRYADIIIANESAFGETLTHLAKAMLNYGGLAQIHFGYNTDKLANADLADYTMVSTDNMVVPAFDKDSLNAALQPYGLSFHGANLSLKTETIFRVYFKKTADYTGDVTFSFDGKTVEPIPWGTGYVYIELANIPAKKIGDVHTIKVGDATFEYSTLNYVSNMLKGDDQNLAQAMHGFYDYYVAADAYFV